jgi:hypothetical protein
VVGTRSSRATERARTERMLATLDELGVQSHGRACPRWLPSRVPGREAIGLRLARALATEDRGHRRALALVDELIAIDVSEAPQPDAATDRSPQDEAAGRGRSRGHADPTAPRCVATPRTDTISRESPGQRHARHA